MQLPPVTLSSIEVYLPNIDILIKYKLTLFNPCALIKALLFMAFINNILIRYILNNQKLVF